jgi:cytochrome c-type biogenesis protein CcmE
LLWRRLYQRSSAFICDAFELRLHEDISNPPVPTQLDASNRLVAQHFRYVRIPLFHSEPQWSVHMNARHKFLIGSGIIIATLLALAYVGFTQSKTYYHTITELSTLQGPSLHQRMRVSGNVRAGSIEHLSGRVDFVLTEQGKDLPVSYVGRDPLPDTFKDGAQALVEGNMKPDNHFEAQQVQAKCASKYEAAPVGTPAAPQPGQTSTGAAARPSGN